MEPMNPKESIDFMEPKGSMEPLDAMASRYVEMSRQSWLEDHDPLLGHSSHHWLPWPRGVQAV